MPAPRDTCDIADGVPPPSLPSCLLFLGRQHMCQTYIPPLKLKEERALKAEFKDEFIGVYHDGTTHSGESFAIVYRACKAGFKFRISCVRVRFLRGSMTAPQISAVLLDCCVAFMQVPASLEAPSLPPFSPCAH